MMRGYRPNVVELDEAFVEPSEWARANPAMPTRAELDAAVDLTAALNTEREQHMTETPKLGDEVVATVRGRVVYLNRVDGAVESVDVEVDGGDGLNVEYVPVAAITERKCRAAVGDAVTTATAEPGDGSVIVTHEPRYGATVWTRDSSTGDPEAPWHPHEGTPFVSDRFDWIGRAFGERGAGHSAVIAHVAD